MRRHGHNRPAVWPYFVAVACLLLVVGCQDGAGPNLVTSPEGKPDYDAVKPPPPPPPPAASPAIACAVNTRLKGAGTPSATLLRVLNADGTNATTIYTRVWNDNGTIDGRPSWSPDGRMLAFVNGGVSGLGLMLIDVSVVNGVPTGSNARLLVPRPAREPAWSPGGDRIAYTSDYVDLYVIPVSGGTPELLYSSPNGVADPTWSADETRIAFAEGGALVVLNLSDGSVTTVLSPQQLGGDATTPAWARHADALAFTGPLGIYTMQIPAGTPALVCAGSYPDWSPDDSMLAYHAGNSVYKVDLATGVSTWLTGPVSPNGMAWYPSWRRF